jgi:thiamine kinase-like enzyme
MEKLNNENMLLIDYEYGGWNPMAMDLANYINETMLDNGYPGKNGIAWYLNNCMTKSEVKDMSETYLTRYFEKYIDVKFKIIYGEDSDKFVSQTIDLFMS